MTNQDEVREENHPMKADSWHAETYDSRKYGGRIWKAVVRTDDTKEKVEWVNKAILDDLVASFATLLAKKREEQKELIGALEEYLNAGHKEARRKASIRAKHILSILS